MERKKPKIASSSNQQSDTNDILRKDDQNVGAKSTGDTGPENDIVPSSNHQHAPILQLPFPTQSYTEQPFSSSVPSLPTQSQSPFVIGQRYQSPNLQLNPNSYQGPPPPHLSQSATPFWLLQHHGYHFPGMNSPAIFQPFAPLGTTNVTWQVPGVVGGGIALKEHHPFPNMCYPYPAFPGSWDLLSCFSEAHRYVSSPPPTMPACTSSLGQSVERGVIRTPVKLSQKHQQLWEAQSAENVQLWTVIGQLKSEIADYKSQIMNLETEVSSLKQLVEEPTAHVTRTNESGQVSKRGRPKRSITSVGAAPTSDDKPRTRGRRPADKSQMENKSSGLVKVQCKEKTCEATVFAQQEGVIASNGTKEGENKTDQFLPSFYTRALQQLPKSKVSAVGLNSSAESKSRDAESDNPNNPFTVMSQQAKEIGAKCSMAQFSGPQNGEHIDWPTVMSSKDLGRNVLDITSQGFYDSNGVIAQDGKMVPGWSFVNEKDASDELEDSGTVSSAKDRNEEVEDDGSSDAEEEIARAQAESFPQFSNW